MSDSRTNTDFALQCPVPWSRYSTVQLAHGGGGRLMRELIEGLFRCAFAGGNALGGPHDDVQKGQTPHRQPGLSSLPAAHDSALISDLGDRTALTTDAFVVQPLFFPGGDIGKLAVFGTVNDLAMAGAEPVALTAAFIIEEGLPFDQLRRVVDSMADAAREVGVAIVAGDTKVVDRGKGDGLFISTSGVGRVPPGVDVRPERVAPGDLVILSGDVGRHGMAVMSVREGIDFETSLQSDCAPLHRVVAAMLSAADPADIHCLRDLTRGGLASAVNEIAQDASVGVSLDETRIPICTAVRAAAELLGLDPLYSANEGRLVAFVARRSAEAVLKAVRNQPLGVQAEIIGEVTNGRPGEVELRGPFGTSRILDLLSGEQMPRIC